MFTVHHIIGTTISLALLNHCNTGGTVASLNAYNLAPFVIAFHSLMIGTGKSPNMAPNTNKGDIKTIAKTKIKKLSCWLMNDINL
jgi:hypothetical protein